MTDGSARPEVAQILARLGLPAPSRVTPLGGGWDTTMWRVEHDGLLSALRLFRAEQQRTFAREVRAMQLAGAGGIPTPEVRAQGAWDGRPVVLLSWCHGQPLARALLRQPRRSWRLGELFGEMQARIHGIQLDEGAMPGGLDWRAWAGAGEDALRARLDETGPRADALLHLDYHPLNVLVDRHGITGVLDWANAAAGEPRADVARTLSILRFMAAFPFMARGQGLARLAPFVAGWRRGYGAVAGPLADLPPYRAWAAAVMVHDLAPRAGRPGFWFTARDLANLERRADDWKHRAGVVS
ncbi:MAG TPA: aminoglycoside phosphotransferase family protein [Thermomicrobiaceae bacterium]|nr:aminoglycoside phosphotransferase family protein [Thermomicrobiaceae bacterium]